MKINTPSFWYRQKSTPPTLTEHFLSPLSALYDLGNKLNQQRQNTKTVKVPVICIGNITAGGSGKTPTCIALHNTLASEGISKNIYFLTRGYGGSNSSTRVITGHEDASETGDEPLLLSKHTQTVVSANRHEGAMHAGDLGAKLIIMDDGFQNQTLHKDLSFLVVDGTMGFGNGKTLPSGPLREPVEHALKRTDAIIFIGKDHRELIPQLNTQISCPIFAATVKPQIDLDKERPYIGFAGLGHPEKFKNTLQECGVKLLDFIPFPDHYPYKKTDLESLISQARKQNARLITTEKDILRIPVCHRDDIDVLPITLEFEKPNDISRFLKDKLNSPIND